MGDPDKRAEPARLLQIILETAKSIQRKPSEFQTAQFQEDTLSRIGPAACQGRGEA